MKVISAAFLAAISVCVAAPAVAQSETPDDRMIFVAADATEGLDGTVSDALSVVSFADIPLADEADVEVLASLLRSNPVSTFLSTPDATSARTGDIYVVADLTLSAGVTEPEVTVGTETIPVAAFGIRLAALIDAFGPLNRQVGFLRISDPDDVFPTAIPDLRSALDTTGMNMVVVMVGPEQGACDGARTALHYAVLAGVPDRVPFGDADGVATAAETVAYLEGALSRDAMRAAPCSAQYSLILRSDDDPARVIADVPEQPLIAQMDQAVYMETFEALFLMSSGDPIAIDGYLAACTYCPSEVELTTRAREIEAEAVALQLETDVWESIREDSTPARLSVYLANCQLCAFEEEATNRIAHLTAAEAARDEEAKALTDLLATDDLAGLIDWRDNCIACENLSAAEARISEIETDGRFQVEQAALQEAISSQNLLLINDWLKTCELCSGKDEAEATLASLSAQTEAAAGCVAAAGLPQHGGPRLLTDIDQAAARAVCAAVLDEYPGNPLVTTIMGRIAQASGDMSVARSAYEVGVAAGLPQAHGLAAYDAYAPSDGQTADYARAEQLALTGLDADDWLSAEVLTVLYSRELVAGRDASDAYEIALGAAQDGNPVAQFFAGFFLRTGTGTEASDVEAARWYGAAVEQGYAHATSFLAEIYETGGEGVEPDALRAAELYFIGLDADDPTAFDRLTTQIGDRPVDVVFQVQARLREAGVFNATVDGISGPVTIQAVDAYAQLQRDAG